MPYTLQTTRVRFIGERSTRSASSPAEAVEVPQEIFDGLGADREHFVILALNTANRVTGFKVISTGATNTSHADPRTLFRDALGLGAASLILAHNHPSGDPTPSCPDIALTRKLVEGGQVLDLKIHDHIILGGDAAFVSFAERGLLS